MAYKSCALSTATQTLSMGHQDDIKEQIQALVDYETKGWNTKNVDLFLSIIHPDMVWPWPPHRDAHDPVEWVFEFGHFDRSLAQELAKSL
jgi:hypothetical protein